SFNETTSVPSAVATTCRMSSSFMMPKSCSTWMAGAALRFSSPATSSYCRSSMRPCPWMSESNGLLISSDMRQIIFYRPCPPPAPDPAPAACHDGRRILRFVDDLLARDHAGEILVDQPGVQR